MTETHQHDEALTTATEQVRSRFPLATDFQKSESADGELIGFTFAATDHSEALYGWVTDAGVLCLTLEPSRFGAHEALDLAHAEIANLRAQDEAAALPVTDAAGIRGRVDLIKHLADDDDPEAAHGQEDALHLDVLRAIADGAADPATLAREALKTEDVRFYRGRL